MSVRSLTLMIALAAMPKPALAQVDQGFRATMAACEAVTDSLQRLACFERAAAQLRDGQEPAGPASRPPEPSDLDRSVFGLSGQERAAEIRRQAPDAAQPIAELTASVTARREGAPGVWFISLEGGSTWQTETRSDFNPPRVGAEVKVRRGGLGGYFLEVDGQPAIRVTRRQ